MKKMFVCMALLFGCYASSARAELAEGVDQPIPRSYGRLVHVAPLSRTTSILFFEADDGTIRLVKIQVQDKAHYRICKDSLSYTINRN